MDTLKEVASRMDDTPSYRLSANQVILVTNLYAPYASVYIVAISSCQHQVGWLLAPGTFRMGNQDKLLPVLW